MQAAGPSNHDPVCVCEAECDCPQLGVTALSGCVCDAQLGVTLAFLCSSVHSIADLGFDCFGFMPLQIDDVNRC